MSNSIFKPRRTQKRSKTPPTALIQASLINTLSQIHELAKNDQYCISKLPALPNVLKNPNLTFNGYADGASNYSVVVSEKGVFVWCYKSSDSSPLTIEFPLDDVEILPLAILTHPSSVTMRDPGIAIINASSGVLKFYESVQHSPALGLIDNKNLEVQIPIEASKGEFITMAENVEPMGIVVVTSWKRVILVGLRDQKNKPFLSINTLMKPKSRWTRIFRNDINDDIVSIRSFVSNGAEDIIIQEKSGLIHIISYEVSSSVMGISSRFTHDLNPYLESSIDGFEVSKHTIKYLDTWRINLQVENTFLILCLVNDSLLLITAKINKSGVLVYGSHKSNRFEGMIDDSKPKLYVPSPENCAFIVVNNSIILTDLDYSYILSKGTILYYRPRWEDIIKLSNSVDVVGVGYEHLSSDSNPALILITSNSGVLRVERFPQTQLETNFIDPVNLVKTHVEQAVFYSSSSIDFTLSGDFSDDIIDRAILSIAQEIMTSKSVYLPEFSPLVGDLLQRKCHLFDNLINYCQMNFHLSNTTMTSIIHSLEKTRTAYTLWQMLDESDQSSKLKGFLKDVIEPKADKLKEYLNTEVDSINSTLTKFLNTAYKNDISSDFLLRLIAGILFNSILVNELKYNLPTPKKSWLFETDLLLNVELYFQKKYCDDSMSFDYPNSPETKIHIGEICEVLYYFINEAIKYMKSQDDENVISYTKWYNKNKIRWIQCLLSNNLFDQAISLVEKYQDFTSLASILEDERERVLEQFGSSSIEYEVVMTKYYVYFEKYQYNFAKVLFDYYIKHEKVQILITGFPRYEAHLNEYFESYPEKVSHIAWIKNLLDGDNELASQHLLKSAELKEGESKDNQELKFSLAKLAIIAAKPTGMNVESPLFKVESELILLRIQKSILDYVNEAIVKVDGGDDLKFGAFLKFVDDPLARETLKGPFTKFINNKALSPTELIDHLISINPTAKFNNGFSNAFRVASLLPDETSYKTQTQKIWRRLLNITKERQDLKLSGTNETDNYLKRKIRNSVFYKTVSLVHDKEIAVLEEMIESEDSNLNKQFIEDANVVKLIRSIKAESQLFE